ncbi:divalent-cation tolerance protein CutA, partial [Acidobacteriota bacterium]
MSEFILVISTVPNEEEGKTIAEKIVAERLAACVSLSSAVQSFYWWQGKISSDGEFMLFVKTRNDLYPKLEQRIRELHSYDVPEIIALPVCQGSQTYLDWIAKETKV